jgi:dTDP-4-dehydrorhamnose 3,5-epimerase
MNIKSIKESATVTSSGEKIGKLIEGVMVRRSPIVEDERGEVSEIFSENWNIKTGPLCYAYMGMIRTGWAKGWVYHQVQIDRLSVISGYMKFILWDPREDSPTYNTINEIYMSERSRGLLVIPPLVVHAIQNVGRCDAYFINLPTTPYKHDDPDKYRVDPKDVPYKLKKKWVGNSD